MPLEHSSEGQERLATTEERRRASRYAIEAWATVQNAQGEIFSATVIDISSSGILLHVGEPAPLRLGDEVTVEVELPDDLDKALSVWGLAKVVRLDGLRSAIQLSA